jgi:hypothetical protein
MFYNFSLSERGPEDHFLRKMAEVADLSFVRNLISAIMFWVEVAFVGTSFAGVRSVFWGVAIIAFMGPILPARFVLPF